MSSALFPVSVSAMSRRAGPTPASVVQGFSRIGKVRLAWGAWALPARGHLRTLKP